MLTKWMLRRVVARVDEAMQCYSFKEDMYVETFNSSKIVSPNAIRMDISEFLHDRLSRMSYREYFSYLSEQFDKRKIRIESVHLSVMDRCLWIYIDPLCADRYRDMRWIQRAYLKRMHTTLPGDFVEKYKHVFEEYFDIEFQEENNTYLVRSLK